MKKNVKWLIGVACLLSLALKFDSITVLICVSPTSYAYHSRYCQGLNKCTHEVISVPIAEARGKYGKNKACGYCY